MNNNEKIHTIIEQCKIIAHCDLNIRYEEPMKDHTTFKVGGIADCWLQPCGENFGVFYAALKTRTQREEIPLFILGGGANIVVSDNGIRGIVFDTGAWKTEERRKRSEERKEERRERSDEIVFKSGTVVDEAVEIAAAAGLSGLEFLAGMPGTIGGAVWMNARCYGSEIADVLSWAEVIKNDELKISIISDKTGFAYKRSPFQEMDCLILNAVFKLKSGDKDAIYQEMEKNKQDRKEKGHYRYPCAGSAFKNNRDFGKPTGQIIDELGLKGFQIGGAQIAPFHGNIVINTGDATAADIRALMDEVADKVKAATGFTLEPEILFIGE